MRKLAAMALAALLAACGGGGEGGAARDTTAVSPGAGTTGTVTDNAASPAAGAAGGSIEAPGTATADTSSPPGYQPVRDETEKDSLPRRAPEGQNSGNGKQP